MPSRSPVNSSGSREARARAAVGVTFLVHSAAFATWAPRIPAIRDRLDLGTDDLGIALGGLAVGMFLGTRLTGRYEREARTGIPIRVVTPLLCLSIIGPAFAPNLWSLTLALALFGVLGGLLDVVMNAHAVAVERVYRRPIMAGFHALWSIGSMIGSAAAAAVARAGVDVRVHFAVAAVLLALICLWPLSRVLDADTERSTIEEHHAESAALRPAVAIAGVVLLATLGFSSFLVEGSIADWSAIFLVDERAADPAIGALGLTVFSMAMAASRLVGDRAAAALGPVRLGRIGAFVALAGFTTVLAVPSAAAALAGLGLLGLGIGPVVPMVFSAAGNTRTQTRSSVLGPVVSAGYVGGVAGPIAIGALAGGIGIQGALVIPLVLVMIILLGAPMLAAAAGSTEHREPHAPG